MKLFRRALLLALCLALGTSSALAQGVRFTLQADIDPDGYPAELTQLMSGLSQLLDAASLEGTLVTHDDSFDLQAELHLGSGRTKATTHVHVYGLDSHWGVSSPLLGDTELMVNCAALLPFGEKARNYLGLPLDMAALLVPYTHENALTSVMTLIAPLFPSEDGKLSLTRAEMDAIVTEFMRLCDEDPALYRWLQATGLYSTAIRYCKGYFTIPEFLLPSLTVKRSGSTLTWTSGVFTLLSIRESKGTTTLTFTLPTLAEASASYKLENNQLTGKISIDLDRLQASGSFSVPTLLTGDAADIACTLDVTSPILPESGLHLRISGQSLGNNLTLRVMGADETAVLLTVEGMLIPFTPETLPAYTPADLTGVNVLSVTSDSLRELLQDVKWPLVDGLFDLLVAAPAPAVQTLMDYAEDSGLIDMLTDAMSGGSGY